MIPLVLDLAIILLTAVAVYAHARHSSLRVVLRYFTSLSNVFCAAASLALVCARLRGAVPVPVLLFKFAATVAVLVTLLTVLFFLGPQLGYKRLLSGPDLWLHLICPVLALLSWLGWERIPVSPAASLLGVLPVLLYGGLYYYKVVQKKAWDDFYGFNRGGKWPLSALIMFGGAALLSLLLALASGNVS